MLDSSTNFGKSIAKVLEVVMFENWLRFYFIHAEEHDEAGSKSEKLYIQVPEQGVERIKTLYPGLYPLLDKINGREINFESSRSAVCEHVLTELDGKTIPKDSSGTVFDSSSFQVELQLFNTFVQAHEAQLDEGFMEFGAWQNFYSQWRQTDAVKEVALKMMSVTNEQGNNTSQ